MAVPVRVPRRHPLLHALLRVVSCAALMLPLLPGSAAAQTDDDVVAARVEGPNRFATAAAIANLTFDTASTAILVTGGDYPDALAGSFAAGVVDGPLLLVTPDSVPGPTLATLAELGVQDVVLLGGTGAIGEVVETQLAGEGYAVERVFGGTRYETAAAVAQRFGAGWPGGTIEGERAIFLASGEGFPDALSAGPIAARTKLPLLLTPQTSASAAVDEALEALAVRRIMIVGGEGAVSAEVAQAYRDAGYAVDRISGSTRTGTAAAMAQTALARFDGFSTDLVLLARGDDFPDALTASIHGAVAGAPLLLSATSDVLSPETARWLRGACPDVSAVRAIGGTGAVSTAVLRTAVDAAGACNQADQVVADYTTPVPYNPDRTENLRVASSAIDGRVIRPGAGFSLDDALGDRTIARGYRLVRNGCIGAGGELIDCVGGGVSQLATTFLSTAWFTGIELAEFRQHTTYFDRYPMCHEATLSRNVLDVVVVNDSPYDITIRASVTGSQMTVAFESRPWADINSWVGAPYAIDTSAGAFSVDCGRSMTYPDGSTTEESYTWRYSRGFSG